MDIRSPGEGAALYIYPPTAEARIRSLEDEIRRLKLDHEREVAHLKIDRDNWKRWCEEAQQVLANIRGLASKIEEAAADALP